MNTWKLRKFNLMSLVLLCPLLTNTALSQSQTTPPVQRVEALLINTSFIARNDDSNFFTDSLMPPMSGSATIHSTSRPEAQGLSVRNSHPGTGLYFQQPIMPAARHW